MLKFRPFLLFPSSEGQIWHIFDYKWSQVYLLYYIIWNAVIYVANGNKLSIYNYKFIFY